MIVLWALGACTWLALVVCAPFLPVPIAALAYLAGSLVCHQLPERSFHIDGAQLPVCARCVGIYAGVVAYSCARMLGCPRGRRGGPSGPRNARTVLVAGALPTAVTVALEWLAIWQPSDLARALAGAPLGAAVAFVVVDAVATLHYEPCAPQRPIAPRPPLTPI